MVEQLPVAKTYITPIAQFQKIWCSVGIQGKRMGWGGGGRGGQWWQAGIKPCGQSAGVRLTWVDTAGGPASSPS